MSLSKFVSNFGTSKEDCAKVMLCFSCICGALGCLSRFFFNCGKSGWIDVFTKQIKWLHSLLQKLDEQTLHKAFQADELELFEALMKLKGMSFEEFLQNHLLVRKAFELFCQKRSIGQRVCSLYEAKKRLA